MKKHLQPMKALDALLRDDVDSICSKQGRMTGTPGHDKAEQVLANRLVEIGCKPYQGSSVRLRYRGRGQDFVNLVGAVKGRSRSPLAPVLVGAHYDSVIAAPCADDNAAAVAIALQVGRYFAATRSLRRDLIVALFDAEEPPHFECVTMGSRNFHGKQMDDRGVHAAVIMDLVGHDVSFHSKLVAGSKSKMAGLWRKLPVLRDADIKVPGVHNLVFVTGSESHPDLPGLLDRAKHPRGIKIVPALNSYVGDMSDHGVFRRNDVPYYFLSCGRWAHYHQRSDTPDRLNYSKMARIAQLVIGLVKGLDKAELDAEAQQVDTIAFEARRLQAALGPIAFRILLKIAGVPGIRTRKDMDRVAEWISSKMGL